MSDGAGKTWFAVSVVVSPEYLDAVEVALNDLDCLGTEIDLLSKPQNRSRTVTGYFSSPPDETAVRAAVELAAKMSGDKTAPESEIRITEIQDQDWLAEWKKYWKPVEVGRFIIAAPWHDVAEEGPVVIRIEPNMAFGTGTHPTTQLCLEAISEFFKPDHSFLDIGTGTGILAIAAAKIADGRHPILAIDNDPDSVAIARENAELNGVADSVDIRPGTMDVETPASDIVCANLTADVIVPILPLLIGKTAKVLILSGILAEQSDMILADLPASAEVSVTRSGEWIAVRLTKP